MRTLQTILELSKIPGPIYLAIGVFDGLHLGHQSVLRRAKQDADQNGGTAVALTFDPHPVRVLRPTLAPKLLTSHPHKLRLMGKLGIDHVLVLRFDMDFAAIAPSDFIKSLASAAKPLAEICVGFEWSFGKDRAGNLSLLESLGSELGFAEVGVPAVTIDGKIVSSTLIRHAVESGNLTDAARYLGRPYAVLGTVVEGDHLGKKMGFPTANLSAHHEQLPPNGVYAVEIQRGDQRHFGVANIGIRPTVKILPSPRLLEVHLFDFEQNLYGEEIEVTFHQFIRTEKTFPSLAFLQSQIENDAQVARHHLVKLGLSLH